VQNRAAFLHAAIMASADDFAVVDENAADGNATLGQAGFGFGDGRRHEWIHHHFPRKAINDA
jgi:hypothetical protein